MTSDFFHPGRTSANVPGLQSERAPFASIADHDFTPATPAQAASASYVPSQNTSLLEQLLPATTSADVIKPLYQPPQTDLSSFPHCDYNAANRYSSMTIIGYTSPLAATSSQPYQGLGNLSMNVRMPELGQPRTLAVRQPPATGLQASRWAIAPPIATNHAQTRPSSTQIEMFTANLQPHEITLKPRNGKSSNLQVSGLTSKMDKLNGLDKPSQGSEANVRSHENNKPPTPPCQPQLQKNFVGLSASKWAS
ncbi:hypothetical protein KEM54_004034 [Ascosphaera aggregata]|nr:hypothetical protein KEM54_004034 [Ascosphaera aggregata]